MEFLLMYDGLLGLSFWQYVFVTLSLTHITIVSVTLYLHRHQAHMGLTMHPALAHFFRFWLWLTTGMVTREWVAVHRKHHAKVETEDDPHSPVTRGISKVLWQGTELYREAARDGETTDAYGHNTPDDWLEKNLYTRHSSLGIRLLLVADLALFGVAGLTVWAIQMAWIPFFAAGVINGIGHFWGYRNFESADTSTNIVPFGLLIGGEELHNNHHAFGSSARFSSRWWEFDIGWMYIRLLSLAGLVRVKKVAPRPVRGPLKSGIDVDILMAIITNRMHVMARYAKDVVARVHDEELSGSDAGSRGMLRRAKRLLIRNDALLDERDMDHLYSAIADSEALQQVYRFKQRLQAIWLERAASQEALVKALAEWCREAEETGIAALEEFARSLRGYSLRSA